MFLNTFTQNVLRLFSHDLFYEPPSFWVVYPSIQKHLQRKDSLDDQTTQVYFFDRLPSFLFFFNKERQLF